MRSVQSKEEKVVRRSCAVLMIVFGIAGYVVVAMVSDSWLLAFPFYRGHSVSQLFTEPGWINSVYVAANLAAYSAVGLYSLVVPRTSRSVWIAAVFVMGIFVGIDLFVLVRRGWGFVELGNLIPHAFFFLLILHPVFRWRRG